MASQTNARPSCSRKSGSVHVEKSLAWGQSHLHSLAGRHSGRSIRPAAIPLGKPAHDFRWFGKADFDASLFSGAADRKSAIQSLKRKDRIKLMTNPRATSTANQMVTIVIVYPFPVNGSKPAVATSA